MLTDITDTGGKKLTLLNELQQWFNWLECVILFYGAFLLPGNVKLRG